MPEIVDSEPSVGEAAIRVFESFLEIRLPRDYRAFLLEHNGGRPDPEVFTEGPASLIRGFYRLNSANTYNDLVAAYKVFVTRLPRELIAIGDDPGGNQICLAVTGQQYGKVFFWDHELSDCSQGAPEQHGAADGEQPGCDNPTLLAENFAALLAA